jgi:cellulose synthase/poly-beta-1,6-N-acetylglucosamine synthase-like glycosyltransferase
MERSALYILSIIVIMVLPYVFLLAVAFLKGRKLNLQVSTPRNLPPVSFVIPTHNEERNISQKIENTLALNYPIEKLEILVADDSSDATPSIVQEHAKAVPAILLLHSSLRRGLAAALDEAYSSTSGSIIVKSDSDSRILSRDALLRAVGYLSDGTGIGAVAGVYKSNQASESAFRSLLSMVQVAESNLCSTIIAHGCFTAFRKDAYRSISHDSLADDTEIFITVLGQGYRTLIDPQIQAIEHHPQRPLEELRQRGRRAEGILRLLISKKGRKLLTSRHCVSSVAFMNLFLIAISPFWLAALCLLLASTLFGLGLGGRISILLFLGFIAIVMSRRDNPLSAFLWAQLAGAIGLASCARHHSGTFDKVGR